MPQGLVNAVHEAPNVADAECLVTVVNAEVDNTFFEAKCRDAKARLSISAMSICYPARPAAKDV